MVIGVGFRNGEIREQRKISSDRQWQRFALSFKARDELGYVYFGPVLTARGEPSGTVWVDALQLERGGQATDFEPRVPVEVAVSAEAYRTASDRLPGLDLVVRVFNGTNQTQRLRIRWKATGFFGELVCEKAVELEASPGISSRTERVTSVEVPFARVELWANGEALAPIRTVAVGPPQRAGSTPFGINHPFPWDEWLELARRIGITWVRDWTLKWDWLEPEPGKLDVARAAPWIDRPVRHGMAMLCMFPFPSAVWCAEEPRKRPAAQEKLYRPIETAFAPKDLEKFKNYIGRCVDYYKDRVRHWEIFNESIFTNYSLPASYGYTAEDYVPLLKAASDAIRGADERAFIIGGYSAPPSAYRQLYERMFALGGLEACDAVSIHEYPGGEPEGVEGDLRQTIAEMKKVGTAKPMWLTEFAYYADDDLSPGAAAMRWPTLVEDELSQALWTQRYCALSLANGVTHIFFHIWHVRPQLDSGAALFFEGDGQPRKVTAAVAALARMLGPAPQPVGWSGNSEDGRYIIVFRRADGRSVAMAWDACAESKPTSAAPAGEWYDAVGRRLARPPVAIGPAPVFAVSREDPVRLLRALQRWIGSTAGQ
ncbi:MAG: hypothetical protein H5T86_13950 [Armatimonadetes bacterium]|nr:hypothetical protein [Armatimonadota bacterium]